MSHRDRKEGFTLNPTFQELLYACINSTPKLRGEQKTCGRFSPMYFEPTVEAWAEALQCIKDHPADSDIRNARGWVWAYLIDKDGKYHPAAFTTREINDELLNAEGGD